MPNSPQDALVPHTDTGERVTPVLDFPSPAGRVNAIRVDYEPGGFTPGTHHHPAGAYVYVMEGSVEFGIDGGEPFLLKEGESYFEPPDAVHSVSRNASQTLPASLLAFFVLADGESPIVQDHD
jgi:quercetin dioxygenase-like cupin family protein